MKLRTIVAVILGIALFASSFLSAQEAKAESQESSVAGAGSYGAVNMDTIDGVGQVKLNGTQVANLHLMGSLIANSAHIGALDISGDVNISDSYVKREANIAGYLRAQKTSFEQPIFLTLQRAVFTTSKLKGITVRTNMGFKGKQVLELRQHTVVDGPIVFDSGKGEIHLYSGSKVLGEVTGAKILKKQ